MSNANSESANVVALKAVKKGQKCPICAKPTQPEYRPFCSKRCADVDLGKWLNESYRVPTDDAPGADGGFDGED